MVDARYVIVFGVMATTAALIKVRPEWATSLTLGLAAAALRVRGPVCGVTFERITS
jgi:hypothetical protein